MHILHKILVYNEDGFDSMAENERISSARSMAENSTDSFLAMRMIGVKRKRQALGLRNILSKYILPTRIWNGLSMKSKNLSKAKKRRLPAIWKKLKVQMRRILKLLSMD